MTSVPIVIEERLRTRIFVVILALAFVGSTAWSIETGAGPTHRHSFVRPLTSALIATLFGGFAVLANRIVVRVVDSPDGRTLEILYGPAGQVRQTFSATDILGATACRYPMWRAGGLGYRGNLTVFHCAALATRRGLALRLDLRGNRRFYVTVDEPEAFAQALLAQR